MWGHGTDWGMMGGWGGGWLGLSGMLIWLLLLTLFVVGVIWLVRNTASSREPPQQSGRRSPGLDVLDERYAKGEIDRDEYLHKKSDIG